MASYAELKQTKAQFYFENLDARKNTDDQISLDSTNKLDSLSHNESMLSSMNGVWFNQILCSQRSGKTCLPAHLGLSKLEFFKILSHEVAEIGDEAIHSESDLRQELLEMRRDEWEELYQLLMKHIKKDIGAELIAKIVSAACLGGGHLWRDLGMNNRSELRQLLSENFPSLVDANHQDMKWKRFFYKQLCEAGGGYVCRAPSCQECTAYDECFGPED